MIRPNFKTALKKGEYAEEIVRPILERDGFVVYRPATEGAHAFDMLAIKNKEITIALDVKAKAQRNNYPDTGIDEKHYQVYKKYSEEHNTEFYIIFVDEHAKQVYGNTLTELDKPVEMVNELTGQIKKYPSVEKNRKGDVIRYWPVDSMLHFASLKDEDAEELMKFSQRNYEYCKEQATG